MRTRRCSHPAFPVFLPPHRKRLQRHAGKDRCVFPVARYSGQTRTGFLPHGWIPPSGVRCVEIGVRVGDSGVASSLPWPVMTQKSAELPPRYHRDDVLPSGRKTMRAKPPGIVPTDRWKRQNTPCIAARQGDQVAMVNAPRQLACGMMAKGLRAAKSSGRRGDA